MSGLRILFYAFSITLLVGAASALNQGTLSDTLRGLFTPTPTTLPHDPEAIRQRVLQEVRAADHFETLPPPARFLDENGLPRFDPEALAQFVSEVNLLQRRVDDYQRRLQERMQAATR